MIKLIVCRKLKGQFKVVTKNDRAIAMRRLTPLRFKKAKPILDRYRELLRATNCFDAAALEQDLQAVLDLDDPKIKLFVIDLISRRDYQPLAARYMETWEPNIPVEFMIALANLYGIKAYHSPDREDAKRAFWKQALEKDEREF